MSSAAPTAFKPYKGTASYQVEDSEFFFGRRVDADQLLARILSARMTLLHAQSGAGKTSLLNATAIPELERRGWTPVRVLPHNDPIASARNSTLLSVMPPPQTEVAAIDRALATIPEAAEGMSINELLSVYDSMAVSDPRRRALIAPVNASEVCPPDSVTATWGAVVPYVCRLLRSTIDIAAFSSHVTAVHQGGDAAPAGDLSINGSMAVTDLRALFESADFQARYTTLLTYLDPPSNRLWSFVENLIQIYGARRSRFALILLFDQFEEIFTRFIDPGKNTVAPTADLPDWRLRYEFFTQLGETYRGRLTSADPWAGDLPSLRFLISMRSEYIAQLGPIRTFAPEIDQSVFQLELLSRTGALEAIQEPARLYGYRYTTECFNGIVNDLTKEDRFVEPAHLSLVCEKLWDETGMHLSSDPGDGSHQIGIDVYETRLQGAKGILRAFLRDYLNGLPEALDRTESLEILEPLITGSGTRNIVERRQLIDIPFRDRNRRRGLLQGLVNRTIVRVEVRLGGNFVEITHEFLIPSIQEAMHEIFFSDFEYQRVRAALQTLRSLREGSVGTDLDGILSREAFVALHDNRASIVWTPLTTEVMLRGSICYSADREAIGGWSRALSAMPQPDFVKVLEAVEHGEAMRNGLSAEELRSLNTNRDGATISAKAAAFILRCQIAQANNADENDIRYWARQVKAEG
jgi:hypothetical protein